MIFFPDLSWKKTARETLEILVFLDLKSPCSEWNGVWAVDSHTVKPAVGLKKPIACD